MQANLSRKELFTIKQISKEEMKKLFVNGYVKNTHRGIVNMNGDSVGFKKTKHKAYIEDRYADLARQL